MAKNKKGFTIIEVVLVLAIAGLIFLMVFIALPALQRSQRNTQREDDISRFLTAANDYQTNNNGKTPFQGSDNAGTTVNSNFVKRYIDNTCTIDDSATSSAHVKDCGSQFTDPDGTQYDMSAEGAGGKTFENVDWPNDHKVMVQSNASCGDEGVAVEGSGIRQYAMFYVLEGGSITCNDNH